MGYEYTQVKDFLEDKGLAEYNFDLFADNIEDPTYNNKLYKPAEANPLINNSNYEYYDPSAFQKGPNPDQFGREKNKQELDDEKRCKVCLTNNIETVIIPCGHRCLCHSCSAGFASGDCPICRTKI